MRTTRSLFTVLTLTLGLTLAGCGSSDEPEDAGDTGADDSAADDSGSDGADDSASSEDAGSDDGVIGTVDRGPVTDVIQEGDTFTVVALGWSDGEIAASLGVTPVAIYDWQGHGEENSGVGPWAVDSIDGDVTVIQNTGTNYNYEQIELLEPDLILNVRAGSDEEVFNRLSDIAPVATAPEDAPDFAVDWRTQTEIIGKAIGKDDEAAAAIAETEQVIADAASPDYEGVSFAYGVKFGDAYGGYVEGDARFDVFGELGFVQNPALAVLATPGGFFAGVAAEQVAALDADVAVLTTIGLPLEELTSDSTINSLGVVTDGRAIVLDETDEINVALAAGTPQSIALAVEQITPKLAEAVAKVG